MPVCVKLVPMVERVPQKGNLEILDNPEIKGLTSELLADVRDIVEKWGTLECSNLIKYRFPTLFKTTIIVVTTPSSEAAEMPATFIFRKKMPDTCLISTTGGDFFWDKNLEVERVRRIIRRADKNAGLAGLIDKETGERIKRN